MLSLGGDFRYVGWLGVY